MITGSGRHVRFFLSLLLLSVLSVESGLAETPSPKALIRDIQKSFDHLETFSCTFRLEFSWSLAGETEVTEGTILLAEGDKFRYQTPQQIMATDGETLWRWSVAGGQAIVENLKDAEKGILPREILFDYPKKFAANSVREVILDGSPTYLLELIPEDSSMGVRDVKVWVDQKSSITRKMQWTDEAGNRTLYTLNSVKINPPLPEAEFRVKLPDGVTVYDLR